ncbi:MAG: hypothetical protein ACE5IR_26160 [bacterium]
MLTNKKINIPDWLGENELLSLVLSHATTKYEYFASRARMYAEKYGTNFETFKKRIEEANDESFSEWDDLIAWEAFETAAEEWKDRYEELQACLTS